MCTALQVYLTSRPTLVLACDNVTSTFMSASGSTLSMGDITDLEAGIATPSLSSILFSVFDLVSCQPWEAS
jgi:hypothetical protein